MPPTADRPTAKYAAHRYLRTGGAVVVDTHDPCLDFFVGGGACCALLGGVGYCVPEALTYHGC